jgi:hypothetical protein
VARASGFKEIEAYVTRTRSVADVDLQPGDSLKEALGKAARANSLAHTEPTEGLELH